MSPGGRPADRQRYFVTAALIFALDQASKLAADAWLRSAGTVEIVPGLFNLSYSRNRGGLFGYFASLQDPWRVVLLTVLPLVAVIVIAVFLARTDEPQRTTLAGLTLILGGATGNLVDRVTRGEVVDFLDVYASVEPLRGWLLQTFQTTHWPTFNIADSAIVIGAGLLILDVVRPAPNRLD